MQSFRYFLQTLRVYQNIFSKYPNHPRSLIIAYNFQSSFTAPKIFYAKKKIASYAYNHVYNNNNYSGPFTSFYYSTRSINKFMYNIITSFNLYHYQTLILYPVSEWLTS